jgi:type II secretory pathway pseudopilin PulG
VARAHSAFTLFEVLLVLILLVIIGSLIMPLFEGGFASVRLRRATDQLLASWSETRGRAIETGQIQQFRYQPESGNYRSEPWFPEEVAPAIVEPVEPVAELMLPDEVVFAEGDVTVYDPAAAGRQVTAMGQGGSGTWSNPILFFPDGSTSAASVLLRNERGVFQRATLRALTGIGRASQLLSEEEAERLKFR